jgi:hypothetical protein
MHEEWREIMSNQISIFNYVHKAQTSLRWSISLVLTLAVSLIFASINLSSEINSNKKILNVLSPYLISQIEVNDRIEILRVLNSVTKNEDSKLILVKDDKVFATTGVTQALDQPFQSPVIN